MSNWYVWVPITIAIIVLSAFFVIIEFALLAARKNRLEEAANDSRSARAALRAQNELTMYLAGAQLGITAATFALGAITKPQVHHVMMPLFEPLGIPMGVADGIAFALSLFIVTFLHLVIGEMAPKSWAIAHPETAARAVAVPANGFIAVFRGLLNWINEMANQLVAKAGVEPVDRAAVGGYDADTLRHLVEHSTETGALDEESAEQISGVIGLETATASDLIKGRGKPTSVPQDATVLDVQRAAKSSGHLRILVDVPREPRMIHVRDTLNADPGTPAVDLSRPALVVTEDTSVSDTLAKMQEESQQLAVVAADDDYASIQGVVTFYDVLGKIWPTIEKGITPQHR